MLARTDLTQLLDELATPATHSIRGRHWHCPMPDHDDRHASVIQHTDHPGHESWRCLSGDHTNHGDAIDPIVATQRTKRADATEWLTNRAGMLPDQPLPPARRRPQVVPPKAPQPLLKQTCCNPIRVLSQPLEANSRGHDYRG